MTHIEKIITAIEYMGMQADDFKEDTRKEVNFPTMNNKKTGFQAQLRCVGEENEYVCFNKKDTVNICQVFTKTLRR